MEGGFYRFEGKSKHENRMRVDGFEVQDWKHSKLAEKALAVFHFSTTYLREAGLFSLVYLKKKVSKSVGNRGK